MTGGNRKLYAGEGEFATSRKGGGGGGKTALSRVDSQIVEKEKEMRRQ